MRQALEILGVEDRDRQTSAILDLSEQILETGVRQEVID